jgi:hypothetical protein
MMSMAEKGEVATTDSNGSAVPRRRFESHVASKPAVFEKKRGLAFAAKASREPADLDTRDFDESLPRN